MGDARPDPILGPDPIRFPNTRRRFSASSPDGPTSSSRSMFAPDTIPSSVEPDSCRICRGEGSPDEPLFYPCKCSGSIKYVHQDCLMEWLSHSQKKHCELCKTPFRFTKLYAHDMPTALPIYVFMSHMTKYVFKNLLVWLRAALVASVWLGWLPYLMRSIWSFLFWISDEGLGGGQVGRLGGPARETVALSAPNSTAVCPSSPLFVTNAAVATITGALNKVPARYGLSRTNASASTDAIFSTLLRLLFGTSSLAERHTITAYSGVNTSAVERLSSSSPPAPSLLSDVAFLRNLTRNPPINRIVIAVLEGQIITILVIVCFILIILVRDYVVQQQPEINMRAAFAAGEDIVPPPQEERAPQLPHAGQHDNIHEADENAQIDDHVEEDAFDQDDQDQDQQDGSLPSIVEFGESANGFDPHIDTSLWSRNRAVQNPGAGEPSTLHPPPSARQEGSSQSLMDLGGTTVHEYMLIYREAGGDPEKILRIVKDRQLEDRLDYWVKLTTSMMDRGHSDGGDSEGDWPVIGVPGGSTSLQRDASDVEKSDGSEWVWTDDRHNQSPGDSKGKGREEVDDEYEDPNLLGGSVLRPRANTDGPIISDTIHPFANNSWSFGQLPQEPSATSRPASSEPLFEGFSSDVANPLQDPDTRAALTSSNNTHGQVRELAVRAEPAGEDSENQEEAQAYDPSTLAVPQAAPEGLQGLNPTPQRPTGDAPPLPRQPVGLAGRVAAFMWGDVANIDPAELAAVDAPEEFDNDEEGLADNNQDDPLGDVAERDREVVEAAVAAGLDPEAIEDAEDLEGILELLGMRGPVVGLFQNAIFCTFLVSITIFLGIFVPYNIGRITVWTMANPMRPARMLFSLSKFVQDCALVVIGSASCLVSFTIQFMARLTGMGSINDYLLATVSSSWSMTVSAANRIAQSFMTELPIISTSEMRNFSAISHEALLIVKEHIGLGLSAIGQAILFILGGDYSAKRGEAVAIAANATAVAWDGFKRLPGAVTDPSSWVINLDLPETARIIKPELAYWNGVDRFWAIIIGYVALSLVAGLYLRRGSPFSSGQTGQEWEASIIDGLNQASGVMKVILIIGIEMLVFPLYCGMLLDIGLLPLFESTSLKSRLLFTVNYPITSIFIHWFVGTGYMFHFALFVSMCRKIMRKGVLYFIRDPDDPEFHPVRDVLERNVTTQLRKILFSAFVYGALVMVCLGGVVWGLAFCLPTVLPIHYSSNEPVLEFPIDLLFYNFLMPLAVKFLKPAEGLHAMYTWWFRKCARGLRITWFLFGERQVDEEGHLVLKAGSGDTSWWRRRFLEVSGDDVVPKTWDDVFEGGTAKPATSIPADEMATMSSVKANLVASGQLIPDGRFVRTPGSDQVKIPKGTRVFLDVSEDNRRQDGKVDQPETDLYSTNQYQFVYVPPNFRLRVSLFILLIWIFAAVTGCSITIIPLIFGRRLFKLLIPENILTNDIYAFSIGIYVLGSAAYALFHAVSIYAAVKTWLTATVSNAYNGGTIQRVFSVALRIARIIYAYFFILLVFPLMVTCLMELYALIPLREVMYRSALAANPRASSVSRHTIRVIQSWTVGLLYLRLGARIITGFFGGTRVAAAVRAVLRRGWLDPDLAVLTRAFVIPGLALWLTAVLGPLLFAKFAIAHDLAAPIMQLLGATVPDGQPLDKTYLVLLNRLSFPVMAMGVLMCVTLWSMVGVFRSWQVRIRDEAYLIGERLHNFGVVNGPPRLRGSWRATGSSL